MAARLALIGSATLALACGTARVGGDQAESGQQALGDADDAAADAEDALDDVDVDEALACIDEGRAALEEAARLGACFCDFAALDAAITSGDEDLQPILDGCTAADDDALALAADASPGACEAVAHA